MIGFHRQSTQDRSLRPGFNLLREIVPDIGLAEPGSIVPATRVLTLTVQALPVQVQWQATDQYRALRVTWYGDSGLWPTRTWEKIWAT